jgi:hypothetical protein
MKRHRILFDLAVLGLGVLLFQLLSSANSVAAEK